MVMFKNVNGVKVQMSKSEEMEEQLRWEAEEAAQVELQKTAYIQQRVEAYPPIGEQLDMLFRAMKAGEIQMSAEWFNTIKGVKESFPKTGN